MTSFMSHETTPTSAKLIFELYFIKGILCIFVLTPALLRLLYLY